MMNRKLVALLVAIVTVAANNVHAEGVVEGTGRATGNVVEGTGRAAGDVVEGTGRAADTITGGFLGTVFTGKSRDERAAERQQRAEEARQRKEERQIRDARYYE
jgi:hypothetical protein